KGTKTALIENLVALTRCFFDLHRVGKAAATSRHHSNAKPGIGPDVLCFHEFLDFAQCIVSNCQLHPSSLSCFEIAKCLQLCLYRSKNSAQSPRFVTLRIGLIYPTLILPNF